MKNQTSVLKFINLVKRNRYHTSASLFAAETVKTLDYGSKLDLPKESIIFSLIQPTNQFHIGNYLGTIKVWRDIVNQNKGNNKLLFGLADLHALTKPKNGKEFKKARLEAVASIVALGVDPEKAVIFCQSAIPEHSELNWILCCLTGMGYLNRMTQWKSKSQVEDNSNVFDPEVLKKTYAGVFMYPVLQAADILLYQSTHVPVGDDQSQHLELCRYICKTFNNVYGNDEFKFPVPKTILAPTKKILSLRDPSKKMSKSDPDQNSCIYITESGKSITKKIRKSVTDSLKDQFKYDPENRPGVSNLLNIVCGFENVPMQEIEHRVADLKDHKELKEYVSSVILQHLTPVKQKFELLTANDMNILEDIMEKGNLAAREIATENMMKIKKNIGLL